MNLVKQKASVPKEDNKQPQELVQEKEKLRRKFE
jgi:hypothetical protein